MVNKVKLAMVRISNPSHNDNNSCCFCWCRCCSCSCLSVKPPSPTDDCSPREDDFSNLTVAEVQSWAESFERLMSSLSGRRVFREFLRCEYSEENILFWLACEDLKKENNPEKIEEKARMIYEDYVSILSPREVSLDSRVREIINKNMMSPTQRTFDEAQLQIYTLMHRDSYPRFVNSPIYRNLLKTYGGSVKDLTVTAATWIHLLHTYNSVVRILSFVRKNINVFYQFLINWIPNVSVY